MPRRDVGCRQTAPPFYDDIWLPRGATEKGPNDEIKSARNETERESERKGEVGSSPRRDVIV